MGVLAIKYNTSVFYSQIWSKAITVFLDVPPYSLTDD
jgi:hypothetical protein